MLTWDVCPRHGTEGNVLAYLTQFGSGYIEFRENVYFNIPVVCLFVFVDTTSILKLVFPTAYCFYLHR